MTTNIKVIHANFTGSHDSSWGGSFAKDVKTFLDGLPAASTALMEPDIQYLNPYPGQITAVIKVSGSLS